MHKIDNKEEGFEAKLSIRLGDVDVPISIAKAGERSFVVEGLVGVLDQLKKMDNSEVLDMIDPYIRAAVKLGFTGMLTQKSD